jgi:hypothetical protein
MEQHASGDPGRAAQERTSGCAGRLTGRPNPFQILNLFSISNSNA